MSHTSSTLSSVLITKDYFVFQKNFKYDDICRKATLHLHRSDLFETRMVKFAIREIKFSESGSERSGSADWSCLAICL